MNLLMAATPLAMQVCGFEFDDAALVLEWHVIGMFAPGFFTGHLIKRFGVLTIMGVGVLLNVLCVAIALSGVELHQFLIALFLLLLGSILDGLALMLLATPILLPVVTGLGLSPIWFGIFLVRAMEIGFIHPPMGMNLYVIQGVAPDVSLARIFRGVVPFLTADFVHLLLLILFPALVLALPEWLA
jgi:TRAP-type C4-dicarboxylate transport system permease large subunit